MKKICFFIFCIDKYWGLSYVGLVTINKITRKEAMKAMTKKLIFTDTDMFSNMHLHEITSRVWNH